MKIVSAILFSLCLVASSMFPATSFAQTATEGQASSLTAYMISSPWLATVDGEDRTRTLKVSGVKQDEPGTFRLDAIYGWTDGNQTSVRAEVIETAEKRSLLITTQPGSKIATVQSQDGVFTGTFTTTSGKVKGITIKRLSESALAEAKARLTEGPPINRPAADVPELCARFIGGWAGDWSFGKRWLWVTEINARCAAKYSYSPQTNTFKSAEIKEGALAFPCGSSGGICLFEYHGDELWARYSGPDGDNTAVFQKVTAAKK